MNSETRSKFRTKELAIVLSHYDLGAIHEIHSYRRGNLHSPKSIIDTDQGKFLLKRRAPGLDDPYRVAMAHHVQLYLINMGFMLPKLIGTKRSNSSMLHTHGSIYELFEFIEANPYEARNDETYSAGQALGNLQRLMTDYQGEYEIPSDSYHNSQVIRKRIEGLLPNISKHDSVSGQEAELQSLSVMLLDVYDQATKDVLENSAFDDRFILCHGDWHPGNLLFRDHKVCASFDFDTVRQMTPLEDVANGCLQFSLIVKGKDPAHWPDEMDVKRASHFLKGYDPHRVWDKDTLDLVIALMCEALIAEAITPIAHTGKFANIQGFRFLKMVMRKINWLKQHACKSLLEQLKVVSSTTH